MNQPTFDDGPPVPTMVEGAIDLPMLRQLFDDLAAHATVEAIREKHSAAATSLDHSRSLADAVERLISGQTNSVQIRYQYQAESWTDTVFRTSDAFRVVRCHHHDSD